MAEPVIPTPTEFDAHLAFNISETCTGSIFFVSFVPRENRIKHISDLADNAATVKGSKKRAERVHAEATSTGSVVGVNHDSLFILTTAHALDHLFRSDFPITHEQVNYNFSVQVLCDHFEGIYREQQLQGERMYAEAAAQSIDCTHDLLLLQVKKQGVLGYDQQICSRPHRPLSISPRPPMPEPRAFAKCVMLSWPPYRHRCRREGHISEYRQMNELNVTNPVRYGMRLMEVTMSSDAGASGAPLFGGGKKVIGILHGAIKEYPGQSYFIAHEDIRNF